MYRAKSNRLTANRVFGRDRSWVKGLSLPFSGWVGCRTVMNDAPPEKENFGWFMLNRSAIVVKPRQPFLDWLHTADPTSHTLTLVNWLQSRRSTWSGCVTRKGTFIKSCANCARRFSWSNWRAGSEMKRPGCKTAVSTCSAFGLISNTMRCWSILPYTRSCNYVVQH